MARVYLKGLPELKRKLIALQEHTAAEVAPALIKAADDTTGMMKRLAPVDEGDLRNSIGWTFGEVPKGAISLKTRSVLVKGQIMKITIYAGDEKAYYARWVEFGTRAHNVAKGGGLKSFSGEAVTHPGAGARPFFYPSWRAMKKPIKKAISKAIQEAVRNVART